MELCHRGLKALVMNNYSEASEHGRIQNKNSAWRGAATEKQVCAMNYTSGEMSHTSDERLSERFLFSHICSRTLCTVAGQSINQSYRGQQLVNILEDKFTSVDTFFIYIL